MDSERPDQEPYEEQIVFEGELLLAVVKAERKRMKSTEYQRKWRANNKEKMRNYMRDYMRAYRKTDSGKAACNRANNSWRRAASQRGHKRKRTFK